MAVMAIVFLLGVICKIFGISIILVLPGMAGAVALAARYQILKLRRESKVRYLILFCCLPAIFLLGYMRTAMQIGAVKASVEEALALETIQGQVQNIQCKDERIIVTVQEEGVGKLLLYFDEESPISSYDLYGQRITATGTIRSFQHATNDGQFDSYLYHINRGEVASVTSPQLQSVSTESLSPLWRLRRALYTLRTILSEVYTYCLPGEEASLMSAMAVGERSEMTTEVSDLFRMAGLIHLFSISSTHISCVASTTYSFFRKCKAGYTLSGILSGAIAILYGVMCGGSISTVRAVGMFLIMVTGNALGQSYDTLSAISLMAILQVLYRPTILTDSSFLFSYGAVLGVILIANPMQRRYEAHCKARWEQVHRTYIDHRYLPSVQEYLISRIITAFGIQLATLPLVAFLFYEVPVYVLFLNLIFLPIFPVLLLTGLIGGVMNIFLPLPWILMPCHLILYGMEAACDLSLRFPMARLIVGRPAVVIIMLFYGLIYIFQKMMKQKYEVRRYLILVPCLLLILMPKPQSFHIDMLDVGQGQGIYIAAGNALSGSHIFYDGGSSDVKNVGQYRILPYLKFHGVRQIDYWILSHTDEDHISGCREVLEQGYPVRYLLVSKKMPEDETWIALRTLAEEQGTEILYLGEGDVLRMGRDTITFVYPEESDSSADKNELCLTFYITHDSFTAFFPGDDGEAVEAKLKQRGLLHDVDLLQAGHHGSNYSNSEALLDGVTPEVVWISAGANNSYGHPGKETIARIEDRGILYFCTMEDGQLSYTIGKGSKSWNQTKWSAILLSN